MAEGLRQRHPPSELLSSRTASPPSYEECMGFQDGVNIHMPPLSQDGAREALMRKVNEEWFANKSPATEFFFVSIQPSPAYRYKLETFTESRTLSWKFQPYTGQSLDTPDNGVEPEKWSVAVHPPAMFEEAVKVVEMPHTASQVTCHKCSGATRLQCWKCKGNGKINCVPCRGSGRVDMSAPYNQKHPMKVKCGTCRGAKIETCSVCCGRGDCTCDTCSGKGRLKKYHQMTVTWRVNSVDRIVELTGLDHACLRKAQGKRLLQEESIQAAPIENFPVPAVIIASHELIEAHLTDFLQDKILMQRQSIIFIPVHEVTCQWRGKQFTYWVYDYDNSAHCPEYPGNWCSCNCTVM